MKAVPLSAQAAALSTLIDEGLIGRKSLMRAIVIEMVEERVRAARETLTLFALYEDDIRDLIKRKLAFRAKERTNAT